MNSVEELAASADKETVKCFVCIWRDFLIGVDIWSYVTRTVFIKAIWMVVTVL